MQALRGDSTRRGPRRRRRGARVPGAGGPRAGRRLPRDPDRRAREYGTSMRGNPLSGPAKRSSGDRADHARLRADRRAAGGGRRRASTRFRAFLDDARRSLPRRRRRGATSAVRECEAARASCSATASRRGAGACDGACAARDVRLRCRVRSPPTPSTRFGRGWRRTRRSPPTATRSAAQRPARAPAAPRPLVRHAHRRPAGRGAQRARRSARAASTDRARRTRPAAGPAVQAPARAPTHPPPRLSAAFRAQLDACRERALAATWSPGRTAHPLRADSGAHARRRAVISTTCSIDRRRRSIALPVHDYVVTPIDGDRRRRARRAALRAINDSVITLNHVVHHGAIGHHVQNAHAYRGAVARRPGRRRRLRAAASACSPAARMAEGWACYACDLMEEIGFLTPLESVAQQHTRVRLLARAVVDIWRCTAAG